MSSFSSQTSKRDFILNANMWKVVMSISFPLVFYSCIDHIFNILDALMVSHIGASEVSAVIYIGQIKMALSSVGAALSMSCGIITARYYGAKDVDNARITTSTMLVLSVVVALGVVLLIVPFAEGWLRLAKAPEDLIATGASYFRIEVLSLCCMFFNNMFIAIEKAKGFTKKIVVLNTMTIIIKLTLTALFVYVFNFSVTAVAVSTLTAHGLLSVIAVFNIADKENIFRFSLKNVRFKKQVLLPAVHLALPVFMERFAFNFGKIIVNSMCAFYGSLMVGALGISNRIAGIVTSLSAGIQDGESTIVSQNLGACNTERVLKTFKVSMISSIVFSTLGLLLMTIFEPLIISFFSKGDPVFGSYILSVYSIEKIAIIPLGISSSVLGFLYGMGKTKLSLALNFARLFVFRIPPLYILQHYTNIGTASVGYAMMISNTMVAMTAVMLVFFVIKKMQKDSCVVKQVRTL